MTIYFDIVKTVLLPPCSDAASGRPVARLLNQGDLPALIDLEHRVWEPHQAASATEMAARIARHREYAVGVFCPRSGRALASAFGRPADPESLRQSSSWQACACGFGASESRRHTALFGISLSSVDADAAKAVFEYMWPMALKNGLRECYLGSPIPGLSAWREQNPDLPVEAYVFSKRGGLPRDRQLRYYYKRGFTRIVGVRANYFPHAASLDYGVLIGGPIPLSWAAPLWKRMPLRWLRRLSAVFFRLV